MSNTMRCLIPKEQTGENCYNFLGFFYIKTKSNNSANKFLKFLSLKPKFLKQKTYAARTFERLYKYFCGNSYNLHEDYKKYYSKEFKTFQQYLEIKHNLSEEDAKSFNNKNACYSDLTIFRYFNITRLVEYDETIKAKFFEFFGGEVDEN